MFVWTETSWSCFNLSLPTAPGSTPPTHTLAGAAHLLAVVSDHRPHQLVLAVELVLDLEEGQSGERMLVQLSSRNLLRARGDSLEDEVVHICQRCSDTLEQKVQGLDGCCFLA